MQLLIIALFGSAVLNSNFFELGIGPVNVLDLFIVGSAFTYLLMHFYNKKEGRKYGLPLKGDRALWLFVVVGVLSALASYAGLYREIVAANVLFDLSYVPRQAYYLFFIPLIILAGRHYHSPQLLDAMCRCYRMLFFAVYVAYVVCNKTWAIDVPCSFCLSLLLLMGRERNRAFDLAMLMLVVLSPIATGGEMTQVVIRTVCLVLYFADEKRGYLRIAIFASIAVILVCFVLPFVPYESIGLDANTSWRLQYWKDEITQLASTWGLGVGYGTSYATHDFIGEAITGPFAATADYSAAERGFVVGCHNSFVSIAFRLGVLGICLLLLYFAGCSQRSLKEGRCNYLTFSVASALAIVCFNVGFESPVYFFLFAFAFAALGTMSRRADDS